MPLLSEYEVYIFDCDGVILDSNQLKIEAMKNALEVHFSDQELIVKCVDYFSHNFGKSRFHHVSYFLNRILNIEEDKKDELEQLILADFSKQCRRLYVTAEVTPGFLKLLTECKGKRYVASGSEQSELRDVFFQRGLDIHFEDVFGSPTPKVEHIQYILKREKTTNAIMFGDAESDMRSAKENNIDFVFYSPYSNVKAEMKKECKSKGYSIINSWDELSC
ncbi:HAD family hydrolase [Vibrio parahaemolyticus]|uniref:phosphoglycolate phosphatase n=1 Tax=Vibrio parahaemolyticus TaxID=670 RepID=A0A7M1WBM2_VIBPH|nr:HAD family hydrolase [Vibrio parahaemolyticus]EHR6711108.1 HAD family hydrolase [Vibrio parahaemolyticus]MCG9636495.1 HAD hydrolase-like protein [Vibrio parahaemolyticus]QOS24460.1 hypothetical protein VP32_00010 [Vibrio parahaemolyticus]TOE32787.1 haloacid dehalogenase [Vibrio parahaemolyticus]HCE2247250.1 HAD family hydrolase [Vibrio parahaemolyticus]